MAYDYIVNSWSQPSREGANCRASINVEAASVRLIPSQIANAMGIEFVGKGTFRRAGLRVLEAPGRSSWSANMSYDSHHEDERRRQVQPSKCNKSPHTPLLRQDW